MSGPASTKSNEVGKLKTLAEAVINYEVPWDAFFQAFSEISPAAREAIRASMWPRMTPASGVHNANAV